MPLTKHPHCTGVPVFTRQLLELEDLEIIGLTASVIAKQLLLFYKKNMTFLKLTVDF